MKAPGTHRAGGYSSLRDLTADRPIVVLAPHPDDESLGCGALLAAAFEGPGAHVVCMTDGGASHPGSRQWPRHELAHARRQECELAIIRLGGTESDLTWLGLPDSGLPELSESVEHIARNIEDIVRPLGARHLFAPSSLDPHCDHKVTAEIARILCRTGGFRLFDYPIWSRWHGFDVDALRSCTGPYRFNTAPWREKKARAVDAHASQLGRLVLDDPGGFIMNPEFVDLFVTGDELFFEASP